MHTAGYGVRLGTAAHKCNARNLTSRGILGRGRTPTRMLLSAAWFINFLESSTDFTSVQTKIAITVPLYTRWLFVLIYLLMELISLCFFATMELINRICSSSIVYCPIMQALSIVIEFSIVYNNKFTFSGWRLCIICYVLFTYKKSLNFNGNI